MDNSSRPSDVLDRVAIALSGLCLLHCAALPLAIAILPLFAQFSDHHLHAQMLVLIIPITVIGLALGFRRHGQAGILVAGAASLFVVAIGGTIAHDQYSIIADRVLTIAGSLGLAVTHYRNFRLSRHVSASTME
jgi:hypothetical protein